jgi:hypothetical protein
MNKNAIELNEANFNQEHPMASSPCDILRLLF